MSNTTTKFAIALFLVLATPAASLARGAGGSAAAGHSGPAAAGSSRANAAAIGTATSVLVDPSGIGNASKVAAPPPPNISVPAIPQFK
jgi:hypothetical protein